MKPDSRIVQVSRPGSTRFGRGPLYGCDGYPECRWTGKSDDVREHMRGCPSSPAGQLYRVLKGA